VGQPPEPPAGGSVRDSPDGLLFELPAQADVDAFLKAALAQGASILSVTPRRESLEDLFVRQATEGGAP
jgi:hypothetical protein